MRNPNGYGSVFKISGNRRKPFGVRITKGWDDNGKQLYEYLSYHESQREAILWLAEYNKNPYDPATNKTTVKEVYDKWAAAKFDKVSKSNVNGYKASWKLCSEIYDMKFVDVKLIHLQKIVNESGKNYPSLRKLKVLFGQLFDYAVMNEIISKDRHIVEYVDISGAGNPDAYNRKPFTKKEIQTIWKWKDTSEYISVILMMIYTGLRIGEMLDLKKENVNLEERFFDVVSSKTTSGIRKVPIADKILPMFEYWMNKNNCEYLLSVPTGERFDYRNYYDSYWTPFMVQMGMNHKPHDTRHTCVSLLTAAGVDERIIKKIVGHKGQGVTQVVYTHLEIEELIDSINKI